MNSHCISLHFPFFSDLGLCSLDFSTVNPSISSWIPLAVLINLVPYITGFSCGCILHKQTTTKGLINPCADFYILCSVIGTAFVVPYFYVNIQNYQGIYVDHNINLIVTLLYFISSLCYTVIFVFFRCCFQTAFLDAYSQKECCDGNSDDNSNSLIRHRIRKRYSPPGLTINTEMSSGIL